MRPFCLCQHSEVAGALPVGATSSMLFDRLADVAHPFRLERLLSGARTPTGGANGYLDDTALGPRVQNARDRHVPGRLAASSLHPPRAEQQAACGGQRTVTEPDRLWRKVRPKGHGDLRKRTRS